MIVVLDTNVLISGIFWKGPPNKILYQLDIRNDIDIAQSNETFEELETVIHRGKFLEIAEKRGLDLDDVLETLFTICRFFLISKKTNDNVTNNVTIEDPDDLVFIKLAVEAGAQFIVSGDPHLLKIAEYNDTKIIKPVEFLDLLSTS